MPYPPPTPYTIHSSLFTLNWLLLLYELFALALIGQSFSQSSQLPLLLLLLLFWLLLSSSSLLLAVINYILLLQFQLFIYLVSAFSPLLLVEVFALRLCECLPSLSVCVCTQSLYLADSFVYTHIHTHTDLQTAVCTYLCM